MNRKGADILWSTIAIAVIVLVVIGVSIYIFGDKAGDFSRAAESCQLKGGTCTTDASCGPGKYELTDVVCPYKETDGAEQKQICCLHLE